VAITSLMPANRVAMRSGSDCLSFDLMQPLAT
jgi:hypothetical protein